MEAHQINQAEMAHQINQAEMARQINQAEMVLQGMLPLKTPQHKF
jgi:hypothetical protein